MRLAVGLSSLARSCWARSSNSIVQAEVARDLAEGDALAGALQAFFGDPDIVEVFQIREKGFADEAVLGLAGLLGGFVELAFKLGF